MVSASLQQADGTLTPNLVATRFRIKRLRSGDTRQVFQTCPTCGAEGFTPISALLTRASEPVVERAFCDRCGHIAFSRMPSAEWFEAHYRQEFETAGLTPAAPPWVDTSALLELVTPHVDRTSRVLDIGCGYGSTLVNFRKLGFTELYGIEPSDRRVQVARGAGFPVAHCTGETMLEAPEIVADAPFDLVISTHAFEHVFDVQLAMANVARVVRPGGFVYICLPHQDAEHFLQMAHYLPHIHSFSNESLRALLERNGVEIVYEDSALRMIGRRLGGESSRPSGSPSAALRDRLRLHFIRDFDLRRHPQWQSAESWLQYTDYRDTRETLEPSYGKFHPLERNTRLKYTVRLMSRMCQLGRQADGSVPAFARKLLDHYHPMVGGGAHFSLPGRDAVPRLDVVYADDHVFPWYK